MRTVRATLVFWQHNGKFFSLVKKKYQNKSVTTPGDLAMYSCPFNWWMENWSPSLSTKTIWTLLILKEAKKKMIACTRIAISLTMLYLQYFSSLSLPLL